MLKRRVKLVIFIFLVSLFTSCIEETELNKTSTPKKIIVEASITNEFKNQSVIISNSYNFETSEIEYETGANVVIKDNNNTTYTFTEIKPGHYQSTVKFNAKEGNSYILNIKTKGNREFISSPEKIEGTSDIDNITVRTSKNNFNKEGVSFNVTSKNNSENAKYFKYDFKETYKIVAPNWSAMTLEPISATNFIVKTKTNLNTENCYKTLNSDFIIQSETSSLNTNQINFDFLFYLKDDIKIQHRYSIELTQKVQSKNAYDFYKTLNKISKNQNVFSYNQPGNIAGNIKPKNNSDSAIGYFEVNYISKKRIFFNFSDLFPDSSPSFFEKCTTIEPLMVEIVDGGMTFPLYDYIKNQGFVFYYKTTKSDRPYAITNYTCSDCTLYGSPIKPDFWID